MTLPACPARRPARQAEDRAHRIGQISCVNIHFLLLRDSVDDIMWEALQNKLRDVGQVGEQHRGCRCCFYRRRRCCC